MTDSSESNLELGSILDNVVGSFVLTSLTAVGVGITDFGLSTMREKQLDTPASRLSARMATYVTVVGFFMTCATVFELGGSAARTVKLVRRKRRERCRGH